MNRLEIKNKTIEPIEIKIQHNWTNWNQETSKFDRLELKEPNQKQEHKHKTYLSTEIKWKWNLKLKDRKVYVVEAWEEGSQHLDGE